MAVYIDNAQHKFGRMKMSHMMADTLEELHDMAQIIGLKREWFQDKRYPHYDVSKAKRREAIEHGAIPCSSKDLVRRFHPKLSEAPTK